MSKPLYELTGAYRILSDQLDEGMDVTDALALLEGALEQKSVAILAVMRELDLDVEKLKAEEQRLTARRRAAEANKERLRDYVRTSMVNAGVTKLKAGTFTVGVSDGPERVVIDDESKIPAAFTRTKVEPDKTKILEAYKQHGECVPGTHVERAVALRIR